MEKINFLLKLITMKSILKILSSTIKGGIFFLLPILIVIFLGEKAIRILKPLSIVITSKLGLEGGRFFDANYLVSILIVIFLCFIAGWVAKIGFGQLMINWIENNILILFPGYQLMKSTMENQVGIQSGSNFPVVLVPIDGLMFGFHMDTLPDGKLVIFVPGAPNVMEGNVIIFEKDNVQKTNITMSEVIKIMRQLGANSANSFNK
jgi:uncharacterized membrane protein